MSVSFAVISLALWLFALAIPILVGVLVYRDAKAHNMPPLLWALVAALAPTFLGIIVYLLVRSNHPALRCPQCDAPVEESFTVCPQCGARLKAACTHCGGPVETSWKVCPHCAEPLDWSSQTVTPPVQARDRRTGKIILLVILIPVVLLIVLSSLFMVSGSNTAVSHTAHYTEARMTSLSGTYGFSEELYDLKRMAWDDPSTTYMLHNYDQDREAWRYLIYLPYADPETVSSGHENGLLGSDFIVKYEENPAADRGMFLVVAVFDDKRPNPKVWRNGDRMDIHIIESQMDIERCLDLEGAISHENQYVGHNEEHTPYHYE